jgi:hypothetical protein
LDFDWNFTIDSFRNSLVTNPNILFPSFARKKWIKIYSVSYIGDWKQIIFNNTQIEKLGVVWKLTTTDSNKTENTYYIEEYKKGILLFYTCASNEKYHEDLGKKLKRCKGASRMWIPPDSFRLMFKGIMEKTQGFIYLFSSRREIESFTKPAKIRPNLNRRIEYRGNDATFSLDEMEELYGVTPDRIYIKSKPNLKMHITNDGLIAFQRPNEKVMGIYYQYLDRVTDEVLKMRLISDAIRYDIIQDNNFKRVEICGARITYAPVENIEAITEKIKSSMEGFSTIDALYDPDDIGFTATMIDEYKKCIFNIHTTNKYITIIPKYGQTFESYIDFYKNIVENVDENAVLSPLDGCH